MKKKIIIFGAGYRGRTALNILMHNFDLEVIAFIDNSIKIAEVEGYKVFHAGTFLAQKDAKEYLYIISGNYVHEMYKQLIEAEIPQTHIDTMERFLVRNFMPENIAHWESDNKENLILFDCSSGFLLGGVEKWTYTVAKKLKEKSFSVRLYTHTMEYAPPYELSENVMLHEIDSGAWQKLSHIFNELIRFVNGYKKVTFICAHITLFSCIAMLMKKYFPDRVRIISVIHSSLQYVAFDNYMINEYVNKLLCVNRVIYDRLLNQIHKEGVCHFKETPIVIPKFDREYQLDDGKPLQIGYAARLEVEHKRSDLICVLIDWLEKLKCNYVLQIAGNGACYEVIEKYIHKNNLEHKIKLCGVIDYSEMYDFWKKQDIAINVSETEGCSLSMLESMACGCIEVITDTIGSDWFIKDGTNGFLIPIGDMQAMAERIAYLDRNRNMLPQIGRLSYEVIKEKCNIDSYIDFFESILLAD